MAKRYYIGYHKFAGDIYVNGRGIRNKGADVIANKRVPKDDARAMNTALENIIQNIGTQLKKRKVELLIDKFFENRTNIEDYITRYIQKVESKTYISGTDVV